MNTKSKNHKSRVSRPLLTKSPYIYHTTYIYHTLTMLSLVNVTVSFTQGHPLLSVCIVARSLQTITKPDTYHKYHYHLCMNIAILVAPISLEQATPTFTKLTYLKSSVILPFYVVDRDECMDSSPCSHECLNTVGSYKCFCPAGYVLAEDGASCILITCPKCLHGGYCDHDTNQCVCPAGFTGQICEMGRQISLF